MKRVYATGICMFLLFTLGAQEENADFVFYWGDYSQAPPTYGTSNSPYAVAAVTSFWEAGINCRSEEGSGNSAPSEGSRVQLKHQKHTRFDHTYSIELYTDAQILEPCNQHVSALRAEVISGDNLRRKLSPGSLSPAQAGTTLWLGWSELYTNFDFEHQSTLLQFLHEEFANSVSASINYHPDRGIYLGVGKAYHPILSRSELKENVWYDWIVEFRYSFHELGPEAGRVRIWTYPADDPLSYTYADLPTLTYEGSTLPHSPSSPFKGRKRSQDSLHFAIHPQLRMGVYRWESGRKHPEEISPENHLFVKYLGPTRLEIGEGLEEYGFEAVKPRAPLAHDGLSFARASESVLDSLYGTHLSLHPNPLSESSVLRISHQKEEIGELKLYDLTGRLLRQEVVEIQSGYTEHQLKKGRLAAGSYILHLQLEEAISSLRFVIE